MNRGRVCSVLHNRQIRIECGVSMDDICRAIEQDSYDQRVVRQAAKRLMRLLIDQLLGDKPLRSRELFQKR